MSSLDNGEKPVHAYLSRSSNKPGFQMTAPGGVHRYQGVLFCTIQQLSATTYPTGCGPVHRIYIKL